MKRPLVLVTWRDAFIPINSTWWSDEDLEQFIRERDFVVQTVGYLVHEDPETLIVVQSLAEGAGKLSGVWRIPVGCVLKRERLETKTKLRVRARVGKGGG